MTDAELLERAAAKLDRLLARTTTGRWQVDGPWYHLLNAATQTAVPTQMVTAGEDRAAVLLGCADLGPGRDSGPDLRYAVAVQPAVGMALARWLQSSATEAREVGSQPVGCVGGPGDPGRRG